MMFDTLTDPTGPGSTDDTGSTGSPDHPDHPGGTGPGAHESRAEHHRADDTHGRHRGLTAPDDTPEANPHGRHRLAGAEQH
ncbi:hypothetical protein [Kitasatospora sp. NBC_00315]|uniref:hypothetical protein n=1 Tax=Kitasatospora sp. NBC_00315 TaxID=2975963 RepID=UPI00324B8CE2